MRKDMKTLAAVLILSMISLSMSGCLGGSGQSKMLNQSSNGNASYYPDGYYDNYGYWHSYYHSHWYSRYFYDDYYGTSYPRSYSSTNYVTPTQKSYKTVVAESKGIIKPSSSTVSKAVATKTQTQKVDLKKTSTSSMKSPSKPVSRTYKSSYRSGRR
jgi:hypothetical protein